jgi:hypothetical protein
MGLSDDIKNNLVDLIEKEIGFCLERIKLKKQEFLDIEDLLKDFQEVVPEISNNKMATVINNGFLSHLQNHMKSLEADMENLKLDYDFNKTMISRLEDL